MLLAGSISRSSAVPRMRISKDVDNHLSSVPDALVNELLIRRFERQIAQ